MNKYDKNQILKWSFRTREEIIQKLKESTMDLIIIGGGINGAGIARDAALRGLKVALLEKKDFGWGTSGRSSKLIHGGLRYLETMQLKLIFEACAERRLLSDLSPNLVFPLLFILPVYRGGRNNLLKVRAGMWLYDLLALFRNFGPHKILKISDIGVLNPYLNRNNLSGAVAYYDAVTDDIQLTLATLKSAVRHGCLALNYLEVQGFLNHNGKIAGVEVWDKVSGKQFEFKAKIIINATGPWADQILKMEKPTFIDIIRPTKGCHLLFSQEKFPLKHATVMSVLNDRRIIFAIPWRNLTIVGTTDTDYNGDPDNVYTSHDDADYLLESIKEYYPELDLSIDDVISSYAGLRPLINEQNKRESQVSREYKILENESGLISLAGGKLTTYRRMSELIVNMASRKLGFNSKCQTQNFSFWGEPLNSLKFDLGEQMKKSISKFKLHHEILAHMILRYYPDCDYILEEVAMIQDGFKPVIPGLPYLKGEIQIAINEEMTLTLSDFFIRRTNIFLDDKNQGLGIVNEIADYMCDKMNWTADEKKKQLTDYKTYVELNRQFRNSKAF